MLAVECQQRKFLVADPNTTKTPHTIPAGEIEYNQELLEQLHQCTKSKCIGSSFFPGPHLAQLDHPSLQTVLNQSS